NQQLLQLAQSLGIDGQILRTGYLSEADTVAALQSCDMLVQPYADGASLRRGTLMACLANGCPTITTNPATRVPELQHNVNVQLVPPNDPAALAAAVRTLQADPALRATLAQGARVLATSFDWASIARRTEEFFSAVLEKFAASAARH
ncbi:MAG: glycosyltransferase, partial [Chloroflexi bacterium]